MDKKQLRKSFLKKRDELDSEYKFEADEKILDKLLSLKDYMRANTICSFVSFRSEVDTHDFIEESLRRGKRVLVPVVDNATKTLVLCEIRSFLDLKKGYMGILEPEVREDNIVEPGAIDLCIVPGAVFDDFGYRIGYGGGFYDKLLPELRSDAKTIGICYDIQRVEKLVPDEYDQKVHTIVSESQVLDI
ncbi:5-formyltetrahydrofolate cyclo-ligase [uncultured Ezakiella sp.]|uniref:5-formyltetrahydrofolate cyclo-ligase n=1 Tax=uncultured Ezakiella sp. TaxID=1637529 RepID=UPI0025F902ED|nr:5-formyltetrahydrofolate cyclo-ligase [uncultured Ezakiella sp.]